MFLTSRVFDNSAVSKGPLLRGSMLARADMSRQWVMSSIRTRLEICWLWYVAHFPFRNSSALNLTRRTGQIRWSENPLRYTRRSLQLSPNPGRQESGLTKSRSTNLPRCGRTGNILQTGISISTKLLAQGTGVTWCQDDGFYSMVKNMWMLSLHPLMIRYVLKSTGDHTYNNNNCG